MSRTTPHHLGDGTKPPTKTNAIVEKEDAARQAAWQAVQNSRERTVINTIIVGAIIGLILFAFFYQP